MADQPKGVFTVSLVRLADGRLLVSADDPEGKAEPAKIAVRKESAVRERLARAHTAQEAEAIMGALLKTGDSTTFSQSWQSLDVLRGFWNG